LPDAVAAHNGADRVLRPTISRSVLIDASNGYLRIDDSAGTDQVLTMAVYRRADGGLLLIADSSDRVAAIRQTWASNAGPAEIGRSVDRLLAGAARHDAALKPWYATKRKSRCAAWNETRSRASCSTGTATEGVS
jgi:hypothetical protein